MKPNTQEGNAVTLDFYISSVNILTMDVDLDKKFASVTHLPDENAVWPIINKDERHYNGLERRLQIFMQRKNPLPELIEEIHENGIRVDYHTNLSIDVSNAQDPKLKIDDLEFSENNHINH